MLHIHLTLRHLRYNENIVLIDLWVPILRNLDLMQMGWDRRSNDSQGKNGWRNFASKSYSLVYKVDFKEVVALDKPALGCRESQF